jgi:hypothetical protein
MIDISSAFSVRLVPSHLPRNPKTGKEFHIATVWRWIRHGVRGVTLETIFYGGQRYTSPPPSQRPLTPNRHPRGVQSSACAPSRPSAKQAGF